MCKGLTNIFRGAVLRSHPKLCLIGDYLIIIIIIIIIIINNVQIKVTLSCQRHCRGTVMSKSLIEILRKEKRWCSKTHLTVSI